jgi:hypothetical protein
MEEVVAVVVVVVTVGVGDPRPELVWSEGSDG